MRNVCPLSEAHADLGICDQTIQHFMVGSDAGAQKPGEKVLALLEKSGLMQSPYVSCCTQFDERRGSRSASNRTRSLRNMRITSKGFQFLLEDVNTQLWDLLLVYLEESQVRHPQQPHSSDIAEPRAVTRRTSLKLSGSCSCSAHSSLVV